jgi:hypothetical protein
MTNDPRSLAADLDRLTADAGRLAGRVRQLDSEGDVVDQILDGELLSLDQAADVAECSDEKIRKACVAAAATKRPLGIVFAGRWFVGKVRLLDDLEQGKIDRRRGWDARLRAEERAKKYEGWARPQEPLKVPDRAAG